MIERSRAASRWTRSCSADRARRPGGCARSTLLASRLEQHAAALARDRIRARGSRVMTESSNHRHPSGQQALRGQQRGACWCSTGSTSRIQPGEFLSIVGASGCGKSTLLRLLTGLDADYEGEIQVRRRAGRGHQPRPRHRVPGAPAVPLADRASRTSGSVSRTRPGPQEKKQTAVDEHIELVGLTGFEAAYPASALGRHGAARGHRARAGQPAEHPAAGRAVRRARRAHAQPSCSRSCSASGRPRRSP